MSRRLIQRLLSGSVLAAAVLAVPVWAAPDAAESDKTVEAVANTPYSATFIVNANVVYVRSGPAESYYPTMKLDKGTKVKAVGMKLDWLKIVPPDGAFCYISKAHVDRSGDGSVGRVNGDAVNVRAGSSMNAMKVVTLCQLSVGEEVKITGEQDEYFKIVPPTKAFLYINKQFVDPDPTATPEKQTANQLTQNPEKKETTTVTQPPVAVKNPEATTQPSQVAEQPGTKLTNIVQVPSTQPSAESASVDTQFEKAEAEFADANTKPLDQQPIAKLTSEYESLVASDKLTNTLHKIAATRLDTLKVRAKAADELAQAKAEQEVMQKKQQALVAERKELEERMSTLGVASYTAVGELQMSSLQIGSKTLYRLTDPANGRTVCYVRTDDTKFINQLGKFVGLKGELTTEDKLSRKVINATEIDPVDPAKVNKSVTAPIVPPSMIAADDATAAAAHVDQHQ